MSIRVHWWLSIGVCCLPLAFLWYRLIDHLRIEWALNPAYSYGWAVPFLCAYLIWLRLRSVGARTWNIQQQTSKLEKETGSADIPLGESPSTSTQGAGKDAGASGAATTVSKPPSVSCSPCVSWLPLALLILCGLFYAPTRLIQEANPEWRFISWALAFIVLGLTLVALGSMAFLSPLRTGSARRHPRPSDGRGAGGEASNPALRPASSALAFPLLFFLVAVPWPTIVEGRLIQWLTGANVAATIELLNLFGIPALQHGNIIEITTGVVGVDDACSGIRSFQATLMLSLFFGELYRLPTVRRIVLCLLGFAASFVFNVGRTFILTYIASKQGVAAIDKWHDPAGTTILVLCFVAIWLVSLFLKTSEREPQSTKGKSGSAAVSAAGSSGVAPHGSVLECGDLSPLSSPSPPRSGRGLGEVSTGSTGDSPVVSGAEQISAMECGDSSPLSSLGDSSPASGPSSSAFRLPPSAFRLPPSAFSLGLLAWLVFVEVGVEWWYRSHEARVPTTVAWKAEFPADNPAFRELPFTDKTRQLLRHDEGRNCAWQEDDGTRWQGIFLRWNPGKIAVHLARSHTPEVCLSAAGRRMVAKSDLRILEANGLKLPFFSYAFEGSQDRVHVFFCLWEDRGTHQDFDTESLTYGNRLAPVLAGRRNSGQRSLELAVWGIENHEQAAAAVQQQLEKIIRVQR